MIKVLIVDDSGFMRLLITDILSADSNMQIVGAAENGKEAFEKTQELKPDVVLLDLTMKEYDGLYAVKHIMETCPTPIIILSGMGNTNLDPVFEAINAGAYDFLNKPQNASGKLRDIGSQLITKIKEAAKADRTKLAKKDGRSNSELHTFDAHLSYDIVVIGSSTGGTGALEDLLKRLPSNFPLPVVIAQHMPPSFVLSFAKRLDETLPLHITVANKGDEVKKGVVYLMPGDCNTIIKDNVRSIRFDTTEETFPEFNFPSVDALMLSVANTYKERVIAVILTGMGKDGAIGMKALFDKNAFTIAQDEKTCVVYGMPKAAIERGAIKQVLPLHEIPNFVVSCLS
jgi:two-component system, chemotaxis family, protein-glutamate methylesterase/glutaminase